MSFLMLNRCIFAMTTGIKFEHFGIFVILLLRASWNDNGSTKRGSLFISQKGIAQEYGCHPQTLRKALQALQEANLIEVGRICDKTRSGTLVTILDYDALTAGDAQVTADEQPDTSLEQAPERKDEKGQDTVEDAPSTNARSSTTKTKGINKKVVDARFERFYSAYPVHKGKESARKAFQKINPDEELLNVMMQAISVQRASIKWQDQQFIPYPARWLNEHRWEDEVSDQASAQAKRDHLLDDIF